MNFLKVGKPSRPRSFRLLAVSLFKQSGDKSLTTLSIIIDCLRRSKLALKEVPGLWQFVAGSGHLHIVVDSA